ncbi:MAG: H-NS histone family protein [Neisseria sp.]|nr:H-NS histone family protein [Neisseria sp.]
MDAKAQKRIEELKKQQQRIASEIAQLRNRRSITIRAIAAKMEKEGITLEELKAHVKTRNKYLNPETGESWSGRGRQPFWVVDALKAGKKLEDFLA